MTDYDLRDLSAVARFHREIRPTVVIHPAATEPFSEGLRHTIKSFREARVALTR